MGYIIGYKNHRSGIAVFLGENQKRLYWLTAGHVLDRADQPLEIDGNPINVEHKFDSDLALISTVADKSKPSNPLILSFVMPKDVSWIKTTTPSEQECTIQHTLLEEFHLTACPSQRTDNKGKFLYAFNDQNLKDILRAGDSGSPILNWNERNVLVGILTGDNETLASVLLFGGMPDTDKNKLKDIQAQYMLQSEAPTQLEPFERCQTWRQSEIDAIKKELDQFNPKEQPRIVVLSGPAKVGKTSFIKDFSKFINERAILYPKVYTYDFGFPVDLSKFHPDVSPCIVICLNLQQDNANEAIKNILSVTSCVLVVAEITGSMSQEPKEWSSVFLQFPNILVKDIPYPAPDRKEIGHLITKEIECIIGGDNGANAPHITADEVAIISGVLSINSAYGYHKIIKKYIDDKHKTGTVFRSLIDKKLWEDALGMQIPIESDFFRELSDREKMCVIYIVLGRTWSGLIQNIWHNSLFFGFSEKLVAGHVLIADRAGSKDLQGNGSVYRCAPALRIEILQKLKNLNSIEDCCAKARDELKSRKTDMHVLVAGFYLSLLTASSNDAESFRKSLFCFVEQKQVQDHVLRFELMDAMADYCYDVTHLKRSITKCYADELLILGDYFSNIPANSINCERRTVCQKFQASLEYAGKDEFGTTFECMRKFLICIFKDLLSQDSDAIEVCISICIGFYNRFCRNSDESTANMCLRVANIVGRRVYELRRSPNILNQSNVYNVVKAAIDSPANPDRVNRIYEWATILIDTGRAKKALEFLKDYPAEDHSRLCIASANVYRALGDLSKAREVLEKAPRGGPDDFELERLALALARDDKDYSAFDNLLKHLQKCTETGSVNEMKFLIEKAETNIHLGNYEDAWDALGTVEEMRDLLLSNREDKKQCLMKQVFIAVETDRSEAQQVFSRLADFKHDAPELFSTHDNIWLLIREGRLLLDTPDSDRDEDHLEWAKEKFERAREQMETEETLCWLAYAYLRLGNIDEAEKCLNQAEKMRPGDTRWWLYELQGDCHLEKSQGAEKKVMLERAIDFYKKAIKATKLPRNEGEVLARIGQCKRISGRFEEAEEYFAKSEKLFSGYAEGLVQSAMTALEQNNVDEALKRINSAIYHKPQYAKAYTVRALIFKDIGLLPVAIKDFETAHKLNERNAETMAHLGETLRLQDKIEEAEEKLNQVIESRRFPNILDFAYVGLAEIELTRGNFSKAQRLTEEALKINSESPRTLATQAKILIKAGERGENIEDLLNRAITGEHNRSYTGIYHFYLAQYYHAKDLREEACEMLNEAITILDKRAMSLPRYEDPFGLREKYDEMLRRLSTVS